MNLLSLFSSPVTAIPQQQPYGSNPRQGRYGASGKATRNKEYCCCCRGHLSMRDAYCRNRACALFMAEPGDINTYRRERVEFGEHWAKQIGEAVKQARIRRESL